MSNRDFRPLGDCLKTLEVLIKSGNPNGVALAENAIDEFLEREDDKNRRTGHLHILEQELDKIWKGTSGRSRDFLNIISDYTARKMRELKAE
jgi:hypothetical protein